MAKLTNNFSGGSDGTLITTANSGGASGDPFDSVVGSNGTVEYDDAYTLHAPEDPPGLSALFAVGATNSSRRLQWRESWGNSTETWVRFYMRSTIDTPANNTQIMPVFASDEDTSACCDLQLRATGALGFRAPSTLRYTSSKTIEAGEWIRVECHIASSETNGHFEARLYYGDNLHGENPSEQFGNWADNWNTGAAFSGMGIGWSAWPGEAGQLWIAHLAVSDEGWIGPAFAGASALPVPAGFTAVKVDGQRKAVASWAAVPNADSYEIELWELTLNGDPDDENDWTFLDTYTTEDTEIEWDETDGLDWGRTYRSRIRALTTDDD